MPRTQSYFFQLYVPAKKGGHFKSVIDLCPKQSGEISKAQNETYSYDTLDHISSFRDSVFIDFYRFKLCLFSYSRFLKIYSFFNFPFLRKLFFFRSCLVAHKLHEII